MLYNQLYNALQNHFESQKNKALFQLELGFQKPVAVGEHPTLVDDMVKLLEQLTNAEECLVSLEDNLGKYSGDNVGNLDEPSENPDVAWTEDEE